MPAGLSRADEHDVLLLMRAAEKVDSGHWLMRCPAHGGRSSASLEVFLAGGRYTLHCIAGCTPDLILQSALERLEKLHCAQQ
jgi:hypothetical protein